MLFNYEAKLALDNGLDKNVVICSMNILLIAATEAEIAPLTTFIGTEGKQVSEGIYEFREHRIAICITGVGMVQAAYHITKSVATGTYDIAIQAGIAGSFDRNIPLGEVVKVTSEQFGDLGAEDHDTHLDIFEMGFLQADAHPFEQQLLKAPVVTTINTEGLRQVKSLTVNTVSGNERTIKRLIERYGCDIESMEGAAFHYICRAEKLPFIQVRAISNYIEPRDRSKWQIGTAVKSLNDWLVKALQEI